MNEWDALLPFDQLGCEIKTKRLRKVIKWQCKHGFYKNCFKVHLFFPNISFLKLIKECINGIIKEPYWCVG